MNIHNILLSNLRSQLSIIPQVPVVFTGTIRFNLDPRKVKNEKLIWAALKDVGLEDLVYNL